MNKLKLCPFCGKEMHIVEIWDDEWSLTCGTQDCAGSRTIFDTEAEAIAAWNKRPDPWVSVDTPPEDGVKVLISDKNGEVEAATHDMKNGGFYLRDMWGMHYDEINCWMPLPEWPEVEE